MAASNFFMRKYYPDAKKVMWDSMRFSGFNLTDGVLEGSKVIDLRIGFGY